MSSNRVLRTALLALAAAAVLTGATVFLLEVSLRIAAAARLVNLPERPLEADPFYQDRSPRFGVWHAPDASFRATRECFDVVYHSNSVGARDRERSLRSTQPRVVVLGDSFVEGVGVESADRVSDRLERATGVEHLNFGAAGNFSSTQEWLLYDELASHYDHERILLFTLPNNDFLENDPERWWQPDRYRPYLRKVGADFELFYPIDFEAAQRRAAAEPCRNRMHNASFTVRLYHWADTRIRVRLAEGRTTPFGYIGYVSYTELDLERLFLGYRKIRDAAGGRELIVFTIPRLNDFLYYEAHGELGGLAERISEFAAREPGIRYVDLLPGFAADARERGRRFADYFLPCDGHWSPEGHEVAARIVLENAAPLFGRAERGGVQNAK